MATAATRTKEKRQTAGDGAFGAHGHSSIGWCETQASRGPGHSQEGRSPTKARRHKVAHRCSQVREPGISAHLKERSDSRLPDRQRQVERADNASSCPLCAYLENSRLESVEDRLDTTFVVHCAARHGLLCVFVATAPHLSQRLQTASRAAPGALSTPTIDAIMVS